MLVLFLIISLFSTIKDASKGEDETSRADDIFLASPFSSHSGVSFIVGLCFGLQ